MRGAPARRGPGRFPLRDPVPTPSAALSRGSRRDPRPTGSAAGGRGTMRRLWGALLLGALLCAHGKRRRRARASWPAGKVCPWVRPMQDLPPANPAARAGARDPAPSLQAAALSVRAGERSRSSPSSSSPRAAAVEPLRGSDLGRAPEDPRLPLARLPRCSLKN